MREELTQPETRPETQPEIQAPTRTTVDGVPTFALEVPGPLRAMLIFRVGAADETLPIRGITHLVEHLAMFPIMQGSPARDRVNATVEPMRTRFMTTGTPEEVAEFLESVTNNLNQLPFDRLENEKKVLRTEAANRRTGTLKSEWSWRYGTRGLGLIDWDEFGLRWLGQNEIQHWAGQWFTRDNAVLYLSGPIPDNLKLNLHPGTRKQLPQLQPLPYRTPAIYQQGDRWVLLSMLGERSTGLFLGARVLDARLRERLRNQESLSYEVHANYQRLDAHIAEISAFTDSLAQNARAAADAMAAEAQSLVANGAKEEELDAVRAERRRMREHPEAGFGMLEQAAVDELEGLEPRSLAELDAEVDAATAQTVAEAMAKAFQTAFLAVPAEVPMTTPGFTPIPAGSGSTYKALKVVAMPGAGHSDVIDYNGEGISLTMPNRTVIGIRWQDVAVALWWTEGKRTLIGEDGSGIRLDPAKWRDVQPLLDAIRHYVPADRWIPMDEPGSMPRQEGPVCSICESAPAIEVTLQNPRSLFLFYKRTVHGIMCRDCGIAKFREVQRKVLAVGWWSVPGLILTPIALVRNIMVWNRFRNLAPPIRTSGINPLHKGSSVLLHPSMLIPFALAAALIWLIGPWH
jgi:predicted Zn-dependent peptidase